MNARLKLLVVPLLAFAGACVNVRAMPLGPAKGYAPVPREQVLVYRSEDEVPHPFEQIAVLYAEGDTDVTDERQMIDAARKKAGQLGANAIVLGEFREPRFSTRVAAAVLDLPTSRKAQFLAVRVNTEADEDHDHQH